MLKKHGGFTTGDKVQVKANGKWLDNHYVIVDFAFLAVLVYPTSMAHAKDYPSVKIWVSINDVRHPHLVRK